MTTVWSLYYIVATILIIGVLNVLAYEYFKIKYDNTDKDNKDNYIN